MDKLKNNEIGGPFHIVRCIGQLAVMYANEKYRDFVSMMEDAENVWEDIDE